MERQNLETYDRKNQGDITGSILVCNEKFEVQHFASDEQNLDLDQGEERNKREEYTLHFPSQVTFRSVFFLNSKMCYVVPMSFSKSILLSFTSAMKENATI